MSARTLGIAAIGVVLALLVLCLTGCVHTPPAATPAARAIFAATCVWTWWDELGEPGIDVLELRVCVQAAIDGQTIPELRAILRARPDYPARSKSKAYGRPPTYGLHAT